MSWQITQRAAGRAKRPAARVSWKGDFMTDWYSKMRRLPLRKMVLTCLLTVLFVGCGEAPIPTGTVKGKVTLDDAPYAEDGSVVFMSTDTGQAGTADIQSDGTFSLTDPLQVGSYAVFIGPKSAESEDGMQEPSEEKIDESLPEKYTNEASTDIKIEIVEGENDVLVPMKS